MADPTSNTFIWSDILVIRSNVPLSNRVLTHSDFIRYSGWLRYVSVVNDMTQLMFGKYQHINRADELYLHHSTFLKTVKCGPVPQKFNDLSNSTGFV